MTTIYHMAASADWRAAEAAGHYGGSGDDLRDGFIHFSTAAQVAESAAKHRKGRTDLLLIAVREEALAGQPGCTLKWEPSRGGQLFPHLYGPLPVACVHSATPLPLGADGHHRFPPLED